MFSFQPDGNAPATLGTADAVAGPLMSWHLDSIGALIVRDENSNVTLQKVIRKGNVVEVLRNGKPATYAITELKWPQQIIGTYSVPAAVTEYVQ